MKTLKNILANLQMAWSLFGFRVFKHLIIVALGIILVIFNFKAGRIMEKGLLVLWILLIIFFLLSFFASARKVLKKKMTSSTPLPIDIEEITLSYQEGVGFNDLAEYGFGLVQEGVSRVVIFEMYGEKFYVLQTTNLKNFCEMGATIRERFEKRLENILKK